MLESPLGHRLNHNIGIGGMVKMAMGQDDGAELISFKLPLGGLNDTPGPGSTSISVPPRFSHMPPEARSWLITTNRAPAVPRKVIVSAIVI